MKKSIPFRSWYYFRTGYSSYFSFILALANMFTLTYYLSVEKNSALEIIFPSFTAYVIISSVVVIPLVALLGYIHMRRSKAFFSEAQITNESNPYNYKLPPGISQEIIAPLLLQLLVFTRKSNLKENLTPDEESQFKELSDKLDKLNKDGMLKIPKKFDDL